MNPRKKVCRQERQLAQSQPIDRPVSKASSPKARKKSFRELFTVEELGYYGSAVIVYIVLGLIFTDSILNFVTGPLFFIGWIWVMPPLWHRFRRLRFMK